MVAHGCYPNTWGMVTLGSGVEVIFGHIVNLKEIPSLKKKTVIYRSPLCLGLILVPPEVQMFDRRGK